MEKNIELINNKFLINNKILLMNKNKIDLIKQMEKLGDEIKISYYVDDIIPYYLKDEYEIIKETLKEDIIKYGLIDTNEIFFEVDNVIY